MSDSDEWETESIHSFTPKYELTMKEGAIIFIQTSLGKYDKYEVINGEYVLVGTIE